MALSQKRGWLITYDISNPKRLGRIFRLLRKHATPVQYSVFYFEGTSIQLNQIITGLKSQINPKEDDVRAYQLPDQPSLDNLGRGSIPDGTLLIGAASLRHERLLHAADSQSVTSLQR